MRLLVSVARRASVDWLPETDEDVAVTAIIEVLHGIDTEITSAADTTAPNDWWVVFDARRIGVPWENEYLDRIVTLDDGQQYRVTAEKP